MENPQTDAVPPENSIVHPLKMLKLKDYITLLGTIFGVASIWVSINGDAYWVACLLIFMGCGCDILDGYVARRLNQHNEIGGQLDSLSDVIVFSVAPATLMYSVYATRLQGTWAYYFLWIATVLFVTCGVLRLAWFNITDFEGYVGLVVPVGALYLVLFYLMDFFWQVIAWNPALDFIRFIAPFFILIVGILEVSPFLIYDKAVKKKQGKIKYAIYGAMIMGIAIIVFGLAFFQVAAVFTWVMTVTGIFLISVYVGIGIRNWWRLQQIKTTRS